MYQEYCIDRSPLDYIERLVVENSPFVESISDVVCFLIRCCHDDDEEINRLKNNDDINNYIKPVLKMLFVYYLTPFGNFGYEHTEILKKQNTDSTISDKPEYFNTYIDIIKNEDITLDIDKWYDVFSNYVDELLSYGYSNKEVINIVLTTAFLKARD